MEGGLAFSNWIKWALESGIMINSSLVLCCSWYVFPKVALSWPCCSLRGCIGAIGVLIRNVFRDCQQGCFYPPVCNTVCVWDSMGVSVCAQVWLCDVLKWDRPGMPASSSSSHHPALMTSTWSLLPGRVCCQGRFNDNRRGVLLIYPTRSLNLSKPLRRL